MSKRQVIMLLGIWVMILFKLGFPPGVREVLALITGVVIVFVASRIRPEAKAAQDRSISYMERRRPVQTPETSVPSVPPVSVPESAHASTPGPAVTNPADQATP